MAHSGDSTPSAARPRRPRAAIRYGLGVFSAAQALRLLGRDVLLKARSNAARRARMRMS